MNRWVRDLSLRNGDNGWQKQKWVGGGGGVGGRGIILLRQMTKDAT